MTTEAILEAAERVFGEHGLHAAKMERIASAAGVAVGTLYNHFKDRDSLLNSLIDARRSELLGRIERALDDGEGKPFAAQLRLFVDALVQHLQAHEAFLMILMEAETAHLPQAVRGVGQPRDAMRQVYDRAVELVQRGVAQRAIRKNDAEIFPTLLMGMLKGCMMRQLYYSKPGELVPAERTDQIVRFFLQGAAV